MSYFKNDEDIRTIGISMGFLDSIIGVFVKEEPKKSLEESHSDDMHTPDEIIDNICQSIVRTSEYEVVRQVHDIIIKNVDYCNTNRDVDHQYLGPLIYRKGVCDGISKLFKHIMDRLSVRSLIVSGDLTASNQDPGPHAWNLVRIDGRWFHIDVTADLCLSKSIVPYRYDYFCLSDRDIRRDHKFTKFAHSCDYSDYCYYIRQNNAVNNIQEFDHAFRRAIGSPDRTMVVRLPYGLDFDSSLPRLDDRIKDLARSYRFLSFSWRMEYNPDQLVIAYSFKIL